MTVETIESRIKELEAEIATLKAVLGRLRGQTPTGTFADLCGALAHLGDFTKEEIDAALYRMDEQAHLCGSGSGSKPHPHGSQLPDGSV